MFRKKFKLIEQFPNTAPHSRDSSTQNLFMIASLLWSSAQLPSTGFAYADLQLTVALRDARNTGVDSITLQYALGMSAAHCGNCTS